VESGALPNSKRTRVTDSHHVSPPPDVAELDQRVAELDARREEVSAQLASLHHELANAPQTDADALARWIADGERGQRPESIQPTLEQEIAPPQ
jgi:hypothetical protein